MLYRLDYIDPLRAVRDPVVGGDLITRHMTTARKRAIEIAAESGEAIQISRIAGAGTVKPSLIVEPDGRCKRPRGTKPARFSDCRRDSGAACFCPACRADRRSSSPADRTIDTPDSSA